MNTETTIASAPKATPEKIKSILEKVSRLRQLANGAGTVAEAENAARMAANLITEYQIEEAQLEDLSDGENSEKAEEGDPLFVFAGNKERWKMTLATRLGNLHGCYTFTDADRTGNKIRIAGRASDVTIVRYLFGWLTSEIDRLAKNEKGKSDRNSFRVGAVLGFADAMKKEQTKVSAAQSNGTFGLVLADRMELSKEVFSAVKGIHNTKSRPRISGALARGFEQGGKLTAKAGLGAGAGPRLLSA